MSTTMRREAKAWGRAFGATLALSACIALLVMAGLSTVGGQ